jgi:hypothetical protein
MTYRPRETKAHSRVVWLEPEPFTQMTCRTVNEGLTVQ